MSTHRVLIVDDSPRFLELVAGLLEDLPDVEVVGLATSGQEGLELAGRLDPDLVLTDLVMPSLDGLELARRLSATHRPPVVAIMSIHDLPQYRAAALAAGAARFLPKTELAGELPSWLLQLHFGPGRDD